MKLACSLDGQTIPISPQAKNNKGNEESLSLSNFTNDAINRKEGSFWNENEYCIDGEKKCKTNKNSPV